MSGSCLILNCSHWCPKHESDLGKADLTECSWWEWWQSHLCRSGLARGGSPKREESHAAPCPCTHNRFSSGRHIVHASDGRGRTSTWQKKHNTIQVELFHCRTSPVAVKKCVHNTLNFQCRRFTCDGAFCIVLLVLIYILNKGPEYLFQHRQKARGHGNIQQTKKWVQM